MIVLRAVHVLGFVLLVRAAESVPRLRRSPQFGAGAFANAQAFGYGRPGFGSSFGVPDDNFRGPDGGFGSPGGYFGGPDGSFGGPGEYGGGFGGQFGGQGSFGPSPYGTGSPSINIAKSVSISRGGGLSSAQATSFGRK